MILRTKTTHGKEGQVVLLHKCQGANISCENCHFCRAFCFFQQKMGSGLSSWRCFFTSEVIFTSDLADRSKMPMVFVTNLPGFHMCVLDGHVLGSDDAHQRGLVRYKYFLWLTFGSQGTIIVFQEKWRFSRKISWSTRTKFHQSRMHNRDVPGASQLTIIHD